MENKEIFLLGKLSGKSAKFLFSTVFMKMVRRSDKVGFIPMNYRDIFLAEEINKNVDE